MNGEYRCFICFQRFKVGEHYSYSWQGYCHTACISAKEATNG
jgi:hypothetical protein